MVFIVLFVSLNLFFPGGNMSLKKLNEQENNLHIMRHSCSHLLAASLQKLRPDSKIGVGPVTQNGFYYDVWAEPRLTEADLALIEEEMLKLKKQKIPFVRLEMTIDEAILKMQALKQPYKVELLELLKQKGSTAVAKEVEDKDLLNNINDSSHSNNSVAAITKVSLYQTGEFLDLCRGPHVSDTSQTGCFKLTHMAGAYWRGNEKNDQLQRIYGICFANFEDLKQELWRIEQARLRDHRKLGKELNLFTFSDEVGVGLPLWLPKGMVLREELEYLAKQQERHDGYQSVATSHIAKETLYQRSGHLTYYQEDMYAPIDIEGEHYYLRAMNCPHHHQIYLSRPHSYRNLPYRLSEYGQVYRYERSGALSGLMRTRSFCQNDAHIYCRFDQAAEEFLKVMRLHVRYYQIIGIQDFYMRFSLPDLNNLNKYTEEPEKWQNAIEIIRKAMNDSGYPYTEVEGEAAFYGPKVDFMIKSVIGVEYAISTNQLDFMATHRFDLNYIGEDGEKHPVYVIHRAALGSHERFIAFLLEHFAGAFPTWLSPIQIRIVPIADRHFIYAEEIKNFFLNAIVHTGTGGLRVDLEDSPERMQKKIRTATMEKIPYIVIIGEKEVEKRQISVRLRNGQDLGLMSPEALLNRLKVEIIERKDSVVE
jgi:threonyl-tRNA synthetase